MKLSSRVTFQGVRVFTGKTMAYREDHKPLTTKLLAEFGDVIPTPEKISGPFILEGYAPACRQSYMLATRYWDKKLQAFESESLPFIKYPDGKMVLVQKLQEGITTELRPLRELSVEEVQAADERVYRLIDGPDVLVFVNSLNVPYIQTLQEQLTQAQKDVEIASQPGTDVSPEENTKRVYQSNVLEKALSIVIQHYVNNELFRQNKALGQKISDFIASRGQDVQVQQDNALLEITSET